MDINRIANIVVGELTFDNLKHQENLETAINSAADAYSKTEKIKTALREITINELMLTKFQSLLTNNQPQNQQNG